MTAATLPLARAALSAAHLLPLPAAAPAQCSGPTLSLSAARTTPAAPPPPQTPRASGSSPASPAANDLPAQRSRLPLPPALPILRSRSPPTPLPPGSALQPSLSLRAPARLPVRRADPPSHSRSTAAGPTSPTPAAPCTPATHLSDTGATRCSVNSPPPLHRPPTAHRLDHTLSRPLLPALPHAGPAPLRSRPTRCGTPAASPDGPLCPETRYCRLAASDPRLRCDTTVLLHAR